MEQPKKSEKPLLMLDMLVSKKASEVVLSEEAKFLYPRSELRSNLV